MKISSHSIQYTIRSCFEGTLATNSIELEGYPHTSWIQLCTDFSGYPIFLISHLAVHTQNLQSDNRCSLLVSTASDEINSPTRLTILGKAKPFQPPPLEIERFRDLIPKCDLYLSIGGFEFYRLIPEKARLISGFGKMGWAEQSNYNDKAVSDLQPYGFNLAALCTVNQHENKQIVVADAYGVTLKDLETQQLFHIPTNEPITDVEVMSKWIQELRLSA